MQLYKCTKFKFYRWEPFTVTDIWLNTQTSLNIFYLQKQTILVEMFFVKTELFAELWPLCSSGVIFFTLVKLIFFLFSGKFGVFFNDVSCTEPLPASGLRIPGSHSRKRVTIETVINRQFREFYDIGFCLQVDLRACTIQFAGGSRILHMCVWKGYYIRFSPKFPKNYRKSRKHC